MKEGTIFHGGIFLQILYNISIHFQRVIKNYIFSIFFYGLAPSTIISNQSFLKSLDNYGSDNFLVGVTLNETKDQKLNIGRSMTLCAKTFHTHQAKHIVCHAIGPLIHGEEGSLACWKQPPMLSNMITMFARHQRNKKFAIYDDQGKYQGCLVGMTPMIAKKMPVNYHNPPMPSQ